MSTPCYIEMKLGEHLLKEMEEDLLEEAAEKLQEEMFESVEKAAQCNSDLADFVDAFGEELYDFLFKRAKEQLLSREDDV
ncbi:hypothetical protein GZ77_21270 [Endozoicomonas montiporae]|uniref:Uncharacterized protein n=2 Tax=Endozoicomonas montiporae TaxID=1027273 RepID=A0A081N3D8_9GAMM|nr:hypothetical protein [Endozoicomonas montiporae]AMO58262.1 hypothetical protein EZMO1_4345 [Endozoicomonas montiporae CL-33]KEQ12961.1 hypothetical protein GZ77_21270 [Endozoicomonas montiporae]